jgi:glycosyltransferase involved in cell wall biosynthesis
VGRSRLRILSLSPYLPSRRSGAPVRLLGLLRRLAESHAVSLLSFVPASQDNAPALDAVREYCEEVAVVPNDRIGLSGAARRALQLGALLSGRSYDRLVLERAVFQAALDRMTARSRYDVIQAETCFMTGYKFPRDTLVVLDEHNIEYELLYRGYRTEPFIGRKVFNAVEYLKVRRAETAAWRRAQACLVTSQREEDVVRSVAPLTLTAVIPNGVDIHYFAPDAQNADPDRIVFTGLLTYRPNIDAVRFFTREVLPLVLRERPSLKLTVVGYGPRELLGSIVSPNVEATGWVPDVRPYLRAAGAVVVPVRMGSGTRLKVLDALAAGKAVVTTSLGCEGIDVKDREHLLIADHPQLFADHVLEVLRDKNLSSKLARRGRELVSARYSWSVVGEELVAFHEILAGRLLDADSDLESLPA